MSHSRIRTLLFALLPLGAISVSSQFASIVRSPSGQTGTSVSDSVPFAGTWRAQGKDPMWNGRFVLILELEQLGDSLHGLYRFDYEGAMVTTPTDAFGRVNGNRIELADRKDKFWLEAKLEGSRLSGRLAGGARQRGQAVPISFSRMR